MSMTQRCAAFSFFAMPPVFASPLTIIPLYSKRPPGRFFFSSGAMPGARPSRYSSTLTAGNELNP